MGENLGRWIGASGAADPAADQALDARQDAEDVPAVVIGLERGFASYAVETPEVAAFEVVATAGIGGEWRVAALEGRGRRAAARDEEDFQDASSAGKAEQKLVSVDETIDGVADEEIES